MKLKISTLFHWLYATLMFLPILMFIPSCLYYGFNEHATNTETTTINYKYESNEVNTLDDLQEDNIYYLSGLYLVLDYEESNYYFDTYILQYESLYFEDISDVSYDIYVDNQYDSRIDNCLHLYFGQDESIILYFTNLDSYIQVSTNGFVSLGDIIFIYKNDMLSFLQDNNLLPQYTDYNVIVSVSVNTDDTITDKVAYAWERTWDLPLFAWTQNSFVAAPFSYITGLFGLGSDNSINYVFTYFVSISICWLVFDLIMYVPNLAHRWLDRSAIE